MSERRRGRRKGEKVGEGYVQTFVKQRGGRRYVKMLYLKLQSADAVAGHISRRHNFYCCGNTIRNLLRQYGIPLNRAGGDRRSRNCREFMRTREL
ncbi:hypothetical protein ACFL67_00750 [candidate division KSB1 bacterium]